MALDLKHLHIARIITCAATYAEETKLARDTEHVHTIWQQVVLYTHYIVKFEKQQKLNFQIALRVRYNKVGYQQKKLHDDIFKTRISHLDFRLFCLCTPHFDEKQILSIPEYLWPTFVHCLSEHFKAIASLDPSFQGYCERDGIFFRQLTQQPFKAEFEKELITEEDKIRREQQIAHLEAEAETKLKEERKRIDTELADGIASLTLKESASGIPPSKAAGDDISSHHPPTEDTHVSNSPLTKHLILQNDNNTRTPSLGSPTQNDRTRPKDSNLSPSRSILQVQDGRDRLNSHSIPHLGDDDTLRLAQNGSHLPNHNRSPQSAEGIPKMLLEPQIAPVKHTRDNGGLDDPPQAGEEGTQQKARANKRAKALRGHSLEQQVQGSMRQSTKHERPEGIQQTDDNYQMRYNVGNTPNSNPDPAGNFNFFEIQYNYEPNQGALAQNLYGSTQENLSQSQPFYQHSQLNQPPPPPESNHGNLQFYQQNPQLIPSPPPFQRNHGNFRNPDEYYQQTPQLIPPPPPPERNHGNLSSPGQFYQQNPQPIPPPPPFERNHGNLSNPDEYYQQNPQLIPPPPPPERNHGNFSSPELYYESNAQR